MFNRIVLAAALVFVACGCGGPDEDIVQTDSNLCLQPLWNLRPSASSDVAQLYSSPPFPYTNGVSNANAIVHLIPLPGNTSWLWDRVGLGTIDIAGANCYGTMTEKQYNGTAPPVNVIGAYGGCQKYLSNSTVYHCTFVGGAVVDYPIGTVGIYVNNKNLFPVAQYIEYQAYFKQIGGTFHFAQIKGHF